MKQIIKIIDYKAGNAPSVQHAVKRLGYASALVDQPDALTEATHIILPGVGSAKATMQSLREKGLIDALAEAVLHRKVWFLGICVGLQILFDHSAEEDTDCLGWIPGRVVKFDTSAVRVPQMGWNAVHFIKNVPFAATEQYFYFVNAYYAQPAQSTDIWGEAEYDGIFTAAICRDHIYATQFHIEKSGEAGLALLNGFLQLNNEIDDEADSEIDNEIRNGMQNGGGRC